VTKSPKDVTNRRGAASRAFAGSPRCARPQRRRDGRRALRAA